MLLCKIVLDASSIENSFAAISKITDLKYLGILRLRAHQRYQGAILEKINEIKGIGDYISSAILLFYFNEPEPLIDLSTKRLYEGIQ